MKFENVCFLFEIPPLDIFYNRYDMGEFINKGYNVLVYDFSSILHPQAVKKSDPAVLKLEEKVEVKHFDSIEKFKQEIKGLTKTFFWSTIPLYVDSYSIIKCICKENYGFICHVDYVPKIDRNVLKNSREFIQNISWKRIRHAIFSRVPRRLLFCRGADYIVSYAGKDPYQVSISTIFGKHTRYIYTNTLDYNDAIRQKNFRNNLVEGKYCVFVDEFFPYHPDNNDLGLVFSISRYYDEMTRFLHLISCIMNMPVIIAAHPKADYASHPECFEDFQIIQYHTAELVKDAELVISHASLALSYVALYQKPLLLVATEEMCQTTNIYNDLCAAATDFEHNIIKVSQNEELEKIEELLEKEFSFKGERYLMQLNNYRLDPQKYENSNKSFFQVLNEAMEKIV